MLNRALTILLALLLLCLTQSASGQTTELTLQTDYSSSDTPQNQILSPSPSEFLGWPGLIITEARGYPIGPKSVLLAPLVASDERTSFCQPLESCPRWLSGRVTERAFSYQLLAGSSRSLPHRATEIGNPPRELVRDGETDCYFHSRVASQSGGSMAVTRNADSSTLPRGPRIYSTIGNPVAITGGRCTKVSIQCSFGAHMAAHNAIDGTVPRTVVSTAGTSSSTLTTDNAEEYLKAETFYRVGESNGEKTT